MDHADRVRRLEVRANADTPEDAARARRFGASGIGLCRTEHMFLGARRELVERLILAADEAARVAALAELLPLQRQDFTEILREMDGLPVTIRLIDPPLHEFLPDHTELSVQVALEDEPRHADARHHRAARGRRPAARAEPDAGPAGGAPRHRGARPGHDAGPGRPRGGRRPIEAGGDPRPEIMVPLVATAAELALVRADDRGGRRGRGRAGVDLPVPIGTMIEVPRAALTADRIAAYADFFSFGTNDLTQMTWGFSRDDVEAAFFRPTSTRASCRVAVRVDRRGRRRGAGRDRGRAGPGGPARPAPRCVRRARRRPASIHFFEQAGLDYVSCSPYRIPVARLEAARARLGIKP